MEKNVNKSELRNEDKKYRFPTTLFVLTIYAICAIVAFFAFMTREKMRDPQIGVASIAALYWETHWWALFLLLGMVTLTCLVFREMLNKHFKESERQIIAQERLRIKAENERDTDELTGLLSKETFIKKGKEILKTAKPSEYTIVCLDVDRFKEFNERFGFEEGDRLLKHIASSLNIYEEENVGLLMCRSSADLFFALGPTETDFSALTEKFDEHMKKFDCPYTAHFHRGGYTISDPSIPILLCMDNAFSALKATKKMYQKGIEFFDEALHEKQLKTHLLLETAEQGIKEGQFEPYYQIKWDYAEKKVIGAEALARWNHPDLGIVYPGVFIPILQSYGFGTALSEAVFRAVCRDIVDWKKRGLATVPISINLSQSDMQIENLVGKTNRILEKYGLSHKDVVFEITEGPYEKNHVGLKELVDSFHENGYSVELDDFGTGNSAVTTLLDVSVDLIKIDGRIVRSCENNYKNSVVLAILIRMARWLGIPVIAEGVENDDIAETLLKMDCRYMQGYAFKPPVRKAEFEEFLKPEIVSEYSFIKKEFYPAVAFDGAVVGDAFDILLTSENADNAMNKLLEMLGEAYALSRINLFLRNNDGSCSNVYEWAKEGIPRVSSRLQNVDFERMSSFKIDEFYGQTGVCAIDDIEHLKTEKLKEMFRQFDVKSILHAGIMSNNKLIGILAFENCERLVNWKTELVGTVKMLSRIIASAVVGRKSEENMAFTEDYRKAMDNSSDLLYIINPEDFTVKYNNKTSRKYFGDATGKCCYECFMERSSPCENCPCVMYLRTGRPRTVTMNIPIGWIVSTNSSLLRYEGEECMLVTSKNVTPLVDANKKYNETKLAFEKEKNASSAKTTFLSSMSHDIRTPMNAIVGMVDIALLHRDDTDKVVDALYKIKTSGKQLISLINDILDISAIESGKLTIKKNPTNLKDMFKDLQNIFSQVAVAKSQELTFDIHDISNEWLDIDDVRVRQIASNLIGNSLKYTPNGGKIHVEVFQYPETANRIMTEFIIEDTGIGMSEDFLKVMWNSFERSPDKRIDDIQGTGLGLSIVKQLISLMDGTVEVTSVLNKGSRFDVKLPLNECEAPVQHDIVNTDTGEKMDIKVLIAEDNDMNWEIANELFSLNGINTERAENGEICLEKMKVAEPGTYDAILMDMQMPIMNGVEATKAIRALPREYCRTIPIIAMTANAFTEDIQRCKEAGMNDHLSKPIDLPKTLAVLKKYIFEKEETRF